MKLLSIKLARSIWYLNVRDYNAKGLSLFPALRSIVELCKFKKVPSNEELLTENPKLEFKGGEFINQNNEAFAVALTVFEWGLIADTISSTQNSDAFLSQMLNHLSEKFNFIDYERVLRNKNYVSHIHVSMEKSLQLVNPKLEEFSQYLTNNVIGHGNVSFEVGSIGFWPDQIRPIHAAPFSIERESGVPFSENSYLSVAPLPTDQHIELLTRLENILV